MLFGLVMVVTTLTAVPAMAVDNGAQCYVCRYLNTGGMADQGYCGDPNRDDWGYEECEVNWFQNCIASGDMCYYIEVRPR